MPKVIDYVRGFADYFTQHFGINTISTTLVSAAAQGAAVGDPSIAQAIQQTFDATTVAAIQHGGAGMITALVMATIKIGLVFLDTKNS